mmetsp:Transcript_27482/g.63545  ORF Transcript_27482/g.63545 Transcript_27482/m.63545 type:complete len:334 (-) Transcript_27482:75-1076(-)
MTSYGAAPTASGPPGTAGGMGNSFGPIKPATWDAEEAGQKTLPLLRKSHGQLNLCGLFTAVFLPWLIFEIVAGALSFTTHFKHPGASVFVVFAIPLIVLLVVGTLYHVRWRGGIGEAPLSSWLAFLVVTVLLCWLVGVIFGFTNYHLHMVHFYNVETLATYPAVDPARMKGQQMMDAGVLMFAGGSRLDLTKAVGFKSGSMYCAAPIVPMNGPDLGAYDFWAVGVDCCSEGDAKGEFWHCGDWQTTRGGGGVRWIDQEQQNYFRLAVQEAQAQFHMQAIHPLFFAWSADPVLSVHQHAARGFSRFCMASLFVLAVQALLALSWAFLFPRRWQK